MKRIAILMTIGFALLAFESSAMAVSSGVTYQGRILKPNGSPLSGQFTQFKLQIRTPDSAGCLMYEEIQSQDLRNSGGLFSLTINDGTGSRTDTTGLTLDRIFANRGTFSLDVSTCSIGSGVYVPNVGDGRSLVVQFKDETMASWEPIPPQKINFVPFAFESKQVQGFSADSLLRVVNGSGDPLTGLAPLSNAQYTALMDLVNGSSSAYTKAGQLNGVALPTMNSGEVLGWNGSAWVSTTASGGPNSVTTAMIQNSAVDSSKIATGAVGTSQIAGNVSINTTGTLGAAITTTRDFKIYAASPSTFYVGMLADPTLGASYTLTWPLTAGSANQVLTTDGSGKLTWSTPSPTGITDLTGDVTATGPGSAAATVASVGGSTAALIHSAELAANAATSANTPNTIVKRDGSGGFAAGAISGASIAVSGAVTAGSVSSSGPVTGTNITASGTLTAATVKTDTLQLNNAGSIVGVVNPAGAAYTLTLPANMGTTGQVLTTNGSGITSWTSPLTSTTAFVQGGNTFSANADLGTNDAYDLNARTNGTTRMTITAAGNVGIGTTAPTVKFEVTGDDAKINTLTVGLGGGGLALNTAVGVSALTANTTGNYNTAIGHEALMSNTSTGYNTAIGQGALRSNTSAGLPSLAVGSGALYNNTTGDRNTAVGTFAMITSTTGSLNTAIGHRALQFATTGSTNTTIGYQGLEGVTTGNQNISLGYRAGANITTGSKNIVIGYDISAPSAIANNQLNVGNIIYGTGLNGTGSTPSTGKVGIGTTDPVTKLEVAGSLRIGDGSETCDASLTGAIRYNGGNIQFCAGSMPWTTLGIAGSGISSLTGDVTATGPGAASATVASVGGSTAALVHSAELLANAATSANTASTIVKRDGSGSFSAGAISATSVTATGAVTQGSSVFRDSGSNAVTVQAPTTVTSSYILKWPTSAGGSGDVLSTDASGNMSWASMPTALPPNGSAGGDLTGSYPNPTVATVGASAANDIHSAELLANAATAANTSNAIVKRDGTGNFTANVGTFNGVALNNAGSVVNLVNPIGVAYTLTLPTGTGSSGQVLTTNGSGALSWTTGLTSSNGFMNGGNSFGTTADLGTNDSYALRLRANGTTAMTVTAAGNVGIGTTAPAEKLDVSGAIKIGNTTNSNAGTLRWTGTNFQAYNGSAWQNLVVDLPASGSCDTTQTYNTPGTYAYAVPASFGTITVKVWGGGGPGGFFFGSGGTGGGTSSVSSLGLSAGGGGLGGMNGGGGTGGTASGGSLNITGNVGSNGTAGVISGTGAMAPNGGGGGGAGTVGGAGTNGGVPGGGGGGGGLGSGNTPAGGGSGGYTEKVFTIATLPPGTIINDIIVGAGGVGALHPAQGGLGGNGQVSITCSTTGSPPANHRGLLFLDSGAYSSDSNLVYDTNGNVGIGTTSPQATIDINGYARLKAYSSQPAVCSSVNEGALAVTSSYTGCICNGTSWVKFSDGATACAW